MTINFPSDSSSNITRSQAVRETPAHDVKSQNFKSDIQDVLGWEGNFLEIGKTAVTLADSLEMGIGEKIKAFQKKYQSNIEQLASKGWSGVKAELREKMAVDSVQTPSFQTMRKEYVELVQQSCLDIVKQMGYSDPGRFSAEGTPGWDSDIDTVYVAPEGMKEEEAMHVQTLFNAISAQVNEIKNKPASILGYIDSSIAFDTECYLQAGKHNPEELVRTAAGRASFSKLELVAAYTQLATLMGQHEESYQEIKERRISSAPEVLQSTLSQSFADSEALHHELASGMEEAFNKICEQQHIDPKTLSDKDLKALSANIERMFKKDRLYAISQKMDLLDADIQACKVSIRMAEDKKMPMTALEKKHDLLQAQRANLEVIRNVLFPESYHTLGSFLEVVAYHQGQSWQRAAERASSRIGEIFDKPYEAQREGGVFRFAEGSLATRQPSSTNRVSSMQENLAMYQVHFLENTTKQQETLPPLEASMHSLVATSKYMQRVIQSANHLLIENTDKLPEDLKIYAEALGKVCQFTLFTSSELERCKRKKILNDTATSQFLGQELQKTTASLDMKADIQGVIERTKEVDVTSTTPEMRFLAASMYLQDLGYVKIQDLDVLGNPILDHPQISHILKARCGFPTITAEQQPIAELITLHNEAVGVTLKHFGLDNENAIESLNLKIEALANEVSNLIYQSIDSPTFVNSDAQDPACSLHAMFLSTYQTVSEMSGG